MRTDEVYFSCCCFFGIVTAGLLLLFSVPFRAPAAPPAAERPDTELQVTPPEKDASYFMELGRDYDRRAYTYRQKLNWERRNEYLEKSINAYLEVIKLEPENVRAHTALAAAYTNSGQSGKAIETTLKSISLSPDDPLLYWNLGVSYTHSDYPDKYERAIDVLKKALELKPKSPYYGQVYFQLGYCYLKLGDLEKATEISDILLAVDEDERYDPSVRNGKLLRKLIADQSPAKPKEK